MDGAWEEMVIIGSIARPHGNRGQVVVDPATDFLEERFRPGGTAWVRGPAGVRRLTMSTVRFHRDRPIVGFEGVATISDAEALGRGELRVPEAALGPLPEGTYYHHDLVGCTVTTTGGETVGEVKRIEEQPAHRLLVIVGASGEVLVPFTSGICVEVSPGARRIVIHPPDGLLELNARSGRAADPGSGTGA